MIEIWALDAYEDGELALAEGVPLPPPDDADPLVREIQARKARLLGMGRTAVPGLMQALRDAARDGERIHLRRLYAHLLAAIGDPRSLGVLERVREGDCYVEASLLDMGAKSAVPALIRMMTPPDEERGPGPGVRHAAGADRQASSVAREALKRHFGVDFKGDPDRWRRWWRRIGTEVRFDPATSRYILRGGGPPARAP
jgi:hypothetical protein